MKTLIAMVSVAFALTSCVGKPVDEMSYTERQNLAGKLVQRCVEQGVKPGTAQMTDCQHQEALREVTTRRRAAERRESGVICQSYAYTTVCD